MPEAGVAGEAYESHLYGERQSAGAEDLICTVEPVLLHNFRQGTFDAVRQVYAVQARMRKRAELDS